MITEEEYKAACAQRDSAAKVIQAYGKQSMENFRTRWDEFLGGKPFTDEDLRYSAEVRCRCGAGLAYPKNCGPWHMWTCSVVLKGKPKDCTHDELPFSGYEIKSEDQPSANGATTRPQ